MYGCLCGAVWSRVDSEFFIGDLEQPFEDQEQQQYFKEDKYNMRILVTYSPLIQYYAYACVNEPPRVCLP